VLLPARYGVAPHPTSLEWRFSPRDIEAFWQIAARPHIFARRRYAQRYAYRHIRQPAGTTMAGAPMSVVAGVGANICE